MGVSLDLDPSALRVLEARYLARDAEGEIVEGPLEMFGRVARAVARAEADYGPAKAVDLWAERFGEVMTSLTFLPNSPTLMNAGRKLGQLSACFVLPVKDSIRSIFDAVKQAAVIHQSGGGTGFNFSRLRPAGDVVRSTHGVSSGPVSFMRVFDLATETIKQGGARRGANMGLLRVDHPDIFGFIAAKTKPGLDNFNLSVVVPDRFMAALERRAEVELINPRTGRPVRRTAAEAIFEALIEAAHAGGEPGVVFIDRINAANPTPALGPIEATNPCGEQPLLPYESCNLGSINLAKLVSAGRLDWDELGRVVKIAVRFLDDVITINRYPLARIRDLTLANRKIGLGVMGFADMLIKLGVAYASETAVETAAEVMAFIQETAHRASEELAGERGVFPNHPDSTWAAAGRKMRHATVTTIAPTGTLSIIAGVSSGIEPLYGLAVSRRVLKGEVLSQPHPLLTEALDRAGADRPEVLEAVLGGGRLGGVAGVPAEIKRLFVTAHEIDWSWHLKIQAAFQRYTDNAVSKTINLPAQAGVDQVAEAVRTAHEYGLKGLTIYRDGSRPDQVLNLGLINGDCPVCGPGRG